MRGRACAVAVTALLAVHLVGCGGGGSSDPGTQPGDDAGGDDTLVAVDTAPEDTAPPFTPADHDPFPQLPAGDGTLLTPPQIITIVAANETIGAGLGDFASTIKLTKWWKTMAAVYGIDDPTTLNAIGPAITGNVDATQMRTYIHNVINAGDAPSPDGRTIYLLYLPPGVSYVNSAGQVNTNCRFLGGAHRALAATSADNYAWVQRCVSDSAGGIDNATTSASHEIIESITDPTQAQWALPRPSVLSPWTDDVWRMLDDGSVVEDADLCEGTQWVERGFTFQRNYSNDAAATGGDPCVPAIDDAYYDVSPAAPWSQVTPGGSVDIALTAWSSGPASDWRVDIDERMASTPGELVPTLSAPREGHELGARNFPIVNNGEVATLHVVAPATAKSGDWVAFTLYSTLLAGGGTDLFHERPVGVYVP